MRAIVGLCLLLLSAVGPLHAQGLGVFVRAGTGGLGGGLAVGLTESLNIRVEGSYFSYSRDDLELEGEYDASVTAEGELLLGSLLADWHPLGGGLRLTVGAVYNGTGGNGSIVPLEPIEVSGRTYTPDEVGSVAVDIGPGLTIAPYGGVGYGNALSQRVGLMFDVGAIYLGSPEVDLTATGMLAPTAGEAEQIEQNLEWVQVYPIVSLGLSLRL